MTVLYHTLFEEKIPGDLFVEKLNSLPPNFREKIGRFYRWQDAYASLFGKLLLLEGFKNFGVSACLSDLRFTRYGKPYLPGSSVCFNISHSGCCVVCVMSNEVDTVGIDVEEIKPVNIKGLQNHWTDREWHEIISGSPTVFYKYWTRKEAILKADGRGLGIPMRQIEVGDDRVYFNDKIYFLNTCDFHNNHILHFASLKNILKVDTSFIPCQLFQ